MEKIYFDETTYIWKTKLGRVSDRAILLEEAEKVIKSVPKNTTDGFGYIKIRNHDLNFTGSINIQNYLDSIIQKGIDECKKLWEETNTKYNKVNTDAWVNVVRSVDPIQLQFKHDVITGVDKFHTHTDINRNHDDFYPHYTYVYYIQMPDVMNGEDGVLYFRGKNKKEYWVKPEEDDLIIMEADMPHAPNNAPNSTIDRIVIAGNVGFDYIKKEKSLL